MSLMDYERPSLTTDIALFRIKETASENNRRESGKSLQVLLIKRDSQPQKGMWSLPGGFVNIDEDIDANVRRKLYMKTGVIGNFYMEQLYTWGDIGRDPRGRVISVSYVGLSNSTLCECDKYNENVMWFDVSDINNMQLAFDHKRIIECALERIRGKAEYTDILLNLLPEEFTINDCKMVFESVLGRSIDNFKRKIDKYVVPLNKMRTGKQFRPAGLFTRRKGE